MEIWIVYGSTGEYSDRSEWPVDAHRTEAAAQARVKALTEALQASGIERMTRWEDEWHTAVDAFKAAHDPRFSIDYTGTSWYVDSCQLRD
jgi:uncharacterized protein YllA (UPF0747 family)